MIELAKVMCLKMVDQSPNRQVNGEYDDQPVDAGLLPRHFSSDQKPWCWLVIVEGYTAWLIGILKWRFPKSWG